MLSNRHAIIIITYSELFRVKTYGQNAKIINERPKTEYYTPYTVWE